MSIVISVNDEDENLSGVSGFLLRKILLKNNLIRSIPGSNMYTTTSSVKFMTLLLYN